MITQPGQPMDRDIALRLAAMIEKRARADAAAWRGGLVRRAQLVAQGRAEQVIDGTATSTDPLRTHLMQAWYVRVFTDELRSSVGLARPQIAVTGTETEHVAECLHQGIAFRILGPGGSAVLNEYADQLVPGQAGFPDGAADQQIGPPKDDAWHQQEAQKLADRLDQRRHDEEALMRVVWEDLSAEQRAAFGAYWHQLHHTSGPAAWPQATPQYNSAADVGAGSGGASAADPPAPPGESISTSGPSERQILTGSPRAAAAATFDTTAASAAELNAARELAAQDFPRGERKPPKINSRGTERHGAFMPQPLDAPQDRNIGDRDR